jgi:hypothetical protein
MRAPWWVDWIGKPKDAISAAKEGVLPRVVDMFGPADQKQLDAMALGDSYTIRVESLRDLIAVYDREIVMLERKIHLELRHIGAIRRCKPSTGSDRPSRRSSSRRSAT